MSPTPDDDPRSWRGVDLREDLRTGTATRPVLARAHATPVPYQHEDEELLDGAAVFEEFRTHEYTNARVHYHAGVEDNGRLKLSTRGHFWGGDDDHQRFKAQYRRPPPPTETVPFDEYEVWMRYAFGTVERDGDDEVRFEANPERTGETLRTLTWSELFTPVQRRLVELELVRNPPFARYVLEDIGEWDDWRVALRYDTDAFAVGP